MAADPRMWQKLLRAKFVDNVHRVTVTMTPSKEYNADLEAAEKERLQRIEAALDDERRWDGALASFGRDTKEFFVAKKK